MSTLNDAISRNVSEKPHQQRKEENTYEQKVDINIFYNK